MPPLGQVNSITVSDAIALVASRTEVALERILLNQAQLHSIQLKVARGQDLSQQDRALLARLLKFQVTFTG